ncbi:MAG: MurT ligase domain-containing protein [Chloroflexota bacterium]|nr:MurT ligase domain-containing protein [Chloroflexota bacterium]
MTSNGKGTRFDPRLSAALLVAKVTAAGIRLAGRGGGTSAPGLVADRIDSGMLGKLTRRLPGGVIVVAGTNGKTTTSRMIADLLEAAGMPAVHNRSGSNLVRGVVSAFAGQASITGAPGGAVGVIESDEAALPQLLERVTPRVVLLNNLFRDQLDRYGELDAVARKWQPALQALDRETTVVVNADDPMLVALTADLRAEVVRFGMDDETHRLETLSHAADAADCHVCGADLEYHSLYVSHLGDWYCPNCSNHRLDLDVIGRGVTLRGVESLDMHVTVDGEEVPIRVGVPGLYNAYNLIAAVAVGRAVGVEMPVITRSMGTFRSAFGRIERVVYRGRTLTLALVKNPVGFNEVLRMLTAESGGLEVPTLIAINDLYADGRDVSWLWDVDFELLAPGGGPLGATGVRGADMANRLKYAGIPDERITRFPDDLAAGLDGFVDTIPEGEVGYILPTYTAMLQVRKILADRGAVETFWKQ